MSTPVPVIIRGIRYPTMAAAAKAFGVSPGTVFKALEAGRLDNVGKGRGWNKKNALWKPLSKGGNHDHD